MRKVVTKGPWEPYGGYECEKCGASVDEDAMLVSRGICPHCGCMTEFREAKIKARRRVSSTHCWGVGRIECFWEYWEPEKGGL